MFEKAREFREKYHTTTKPSQEDQDLIKAGKILEKHAQKYSRKCSSLRSEILVMETEISLIQKELEEFLLLYYEKFSGLLHGRNALFPAPSEPAPDRSDDNITLFEKRSEAFAKELKNIYRRLVKNFHPDLNHNSRENIHFHRIQSSYENGDLTELLYIQSQFEEHQERNVIERIERLEVEIKACEKKLVKLVERKSKIISTPEYRLFMKFRLSEVRGYDFFGELSKAPGLSAEKLN